jgi:predicted nucleic-acid-binding Zn-ribbon protein
MEIVMSKANAEKVLADQFICSHCKSIGAHVEKLSMAGTGISRFLEIQPYRYAFVSCHNCGFTEVFNLKTLEGKDDLGTFLDILFAN